MYWTRSKPNCNGIRRDKVALRTTCNKNVKFKIIKMRTSCEYVGYFRYSENLNWAACGSRVGHSWFRLNNALHTTQENNMRMLAFASRFYVAAQIQTDGYVEIEYFQTIAKNTWIIFIKHTCGTVARKSSIGGFTLVQGGLDILKFDKNSAYLYCFISQFREAWTFFWRAELTKPPAAAAVHTCTDFSKMTFYISRKDLGWFIENASIRH